MQYFNVPDGGKKVSKMNGSFITSLKTTSFFYSQMINSILQHLINISLNGLVRGSGAGEGVGQMGVDVSHEREHDPFKFHFTTHFMFRVEFA